MTLAGAAPSMAAGFRLFQRASREVVLAKESPKKGQEPSYEEVLARLEEVVKRLEAGNLPLEESLQAFETGISLVRSGEARLGEAEKRIEQLLATAAGVRVAPFESEGAAEAGRAGARPSPRAGEPADGDGDPF